MVIDIYKGKFFSGYQKMNRMLLDMPHCLIKSRKTIVITSIVSTIFITFPVIFFIKKEKRKMIMNYLRATVKDVGYIFMRASVFWIPQNILFPKPKKDINKIKILLVHGYGESESCWFFFRRYMQKKGIGYAYTLNLGIPFYSIATYVKIVAMTIDKITNPGDKVILIGHSMGGIVCSDCATIKEQVIGVISLGSPLRGSLMTRLAYGISAQEMNVGSKYINSLNKKILEATEVRFFQYYSIADVIVQPPTNGHSFEENPPHVICREKPDLGHVALLWDAPTLSQVISDINNLKIINSTN